MPSNWGATLKKNLLSFEQIHSFKRRPHSGILKGFIVMRNKQEVTNAVIFCMDVVVVLLFYVHGKHLGSCRDGQLT